MKRETISGKNFRSNDIPGLKLFGNFYSGEVLRNFLLPGYASRM